ncbi:hypothetical protein LIA77_02891 [Sarocladium implicatum]|nr:hypothetical protein LIA77_02891 [Sarocladium implicatum]
MHAFLIVPGHPRADPCFRGAKRRCQRLSSIHARTTTSAHTVTASHFYCSNMRRTVVANAKMIVQTRLWHVTIRIGKLLRLAKARFIIAKTLLHQTRQFPQPDIAEITPS